VLLLVVSLILFLLESTLSLEVVAFLEDLLCGLRSIVKLKSGDLFVSRGQFLLDSLVVSGKLVVVLGQASDLTMQLVV
jgi:hypothetical protein